MTGKKTPTARGTRPVERTAAPVATIRHKAEVPPHDTPPRQEMPAPTARKVAPGLHFLATPIGAARDITLRALDILSEADVLAAEDTRSLRHLMELHGITLGGRPLVAYHDHNGPAVRPRLMAALAEGKSVAYASEAGTPLVADPGYQLARAAIEAGHPLHTAPGPSAVLAALTVSGLPTDRFLFAGFAPAQAGPRKRFLEELRDVPATLVLFESPRRINRILVELAKAWGPEREAAICRELTKRFEEVRRGTLGILADATADTREKGEIVLVVDRARPTAERLSEAQGNLEARLTEALKDMSVKEAAAKIAVETGLPRRQVYQAALALGDDR